MKKTLSILLTIVLISVLTSCTGNNPPDDSGTVEESSPSAEMIPTATVKASATEIGVGDKVSFTVKLSGCPDIKTAGFEIVFDNECFAIVSGEVMVNGDLSDFSDNIGVIAFSHETDMNKNVFKFTLKAIAPAKKEEVTCHISLKDKNDKAVDAEVISAVVTVKES